MNIKTNFFIITVIFIVFATKYSSGNNLNDPEPKLLFSYVVCVFFYFRKYSFCKFIKIPTFTHLINKY